MIWLLVGILIFAVGWVLLRLWYCPEPSSHTLYFGAVRSGKTMFLTKLAIRNAKKGRPVYSNYQIMYPGIYQLKKSDFGQLDFGEGSILLFDEASLNGFDNRDFKDNFKDNNALEFFKLVGHFKNAIVWSNQGWDECDKKIRTICSSLYLVKRLPFVSIAIRIYMDSHIDEISQEPADCYKFASPFRVIFDPRVVQLVWRSKYGKYYNSWVHPDYISAPRIEWKDI